MKKRKQSSPQSSTTARRPSNVVRAGFVWILVLPLLFALTAPAICADPLDPSVIGILPRDVAEIGYANLSEARQLPWFPQFESQIVPVPLYQFDEFLSDAQNRSDSSIDDVVWARFSQAKANGTARMATVIIASGDFDPNALGSFLKTHSIPAIHLDEQTTAYSAEAGFGSDELFFTLLGPNAVVVGPLDALKEIMSVRAGYQDSLYANEQLMHGIELVNGEGLFWGVLGPSDAQATILRLVPMAAAFAQSAKIMRCITDVAFSVSDSGGVQVQFHAATASGKDSLVLSQLLLAGLLYRQYKSSAMNPGLSQILAATTVASSGPRLEISLGFTDDEMLDLIEHDTLGAAF